MSKSPRVRAAVLAATIPAVLAGGLIAQTVLAAEAGAVTVTKVQLKGTQLRVEGRLTTPGLSFVSVESTTSAAGGRGDGNGVFKVQSDTFTAPDCSITVNDFGSPALTVAIPGCTPSIKPVPTNPAPPTGSCVITPQPTPTTLSAGTMSVFWFTATGCNPSSPLSYTVVAGAIPTGMTVGGFQNSSAGNIIGTPSIPGTYRFTIQVTDAAGATDQENFTINVV
jgi:hypothetical protein